MKVSILDLLTFNGGYVDTAGFLALQGLFTAHVTGNFVTIGASLVHGTSGVIAKLLALPVFCAVVVLTRAFSDSLPREGRKAVNVLIAVKVMLFVAAAALALCLGPFTNGDSLGAIGAGMTLVAAMAIQNTIHRLFLTKSPPTTLMTGNTTQIMMNVAELLRGDLAPAARSTLRTTSLALARSICVFAAGCAAAALIFAAAHGGVFVLPPLIATLASLPGLRSGIAPATA